MTVLDDEFKYHETNMSCLNILTLPYEYRCMLFKRVKNCEAIINYFNYFEMIYCCFHIDNKAKESALLFSLLIIVLLYMLLMALVVDAYLTPALKIISIQLHMNEYLAGITLLAFGNAWGDMIANLLPIRAESSIYSGVLSESIAIILLVGGLICYMKPFKIDGNCLVRDLLFLLLGVECVRYVMFSGTQVTVLESLLLLLLYVVYLTVNVIDYILLQYALKKLRQNVSALNLLPISPARDRQLDDANLKVKQLEQHEKLILHKRNTQFLVAKTGSLHTDIYVAPPADDQTHVVDYQKTRAMLHNKINEKNIFLWQELFESLNPVDSVTWQLGGWLRRFIIVVTTPLLFVTNLFVPAVDYERYKHGWSKLLNCTHIITNPFIMITAMHSKFASRYYSWYIEPNIFYAKWSFLLTVPLALIVFFHARTDLPPPYHFIFTVMSGVSALIIVALCAAEIEVLTAIMGVVCGFAEDFLDVTFKAISSTFIDLITNSSLTLQGYEKMAFAAVFAGPFFSVVVSMGLALLLNQEAHNTGSSYWLYGEYGETCYVFMLITVITTLIWSCTFNFFTRRSIGIYYWLLYILFILYTTIAEMHLVHDLNTDPFIRLV